MSNNSSTLDYGRQKVAATSSLCRASSRTDQVPPHLFTSCNEIAGYRLQKNYACKQPPVLAIPQRRNEAAGACVQHTLVSSKIDAKGSASCVIPGSVLLSVKNGKCEKNAVRLCPPVFMQITPSANLTLTT